MELKPLRFIGETVEVLFDRPPTLKKKPGCPDGFIWEGEEFRVEDMITEWHDYQRRGRMKHNMRPPNITKAMRRGSWGVGRDYYRVRTTSGQIFDLYYDRAPKNVDDRVGNWFLFREMTAPDE